MIGMGQPNYSRGWHPRFERFRLRPGRGFVARFDCRTCGWVIGQERA